MLALILMQLIAMIGAAGIMSAVFRRMGQPGVIDEIVAGLMLGLSMFGHFFPKPRSCCSASALPRRSPSSARSASSC